MWQTLSNGGPYGEKRPYLSTLPGVGSNPATPPTCPASEGSFQILRHFSKRCVHFIIILTPLPNIPSVVTAVRSLSLMGGVARWGVGCWVTPFGIAPMGLSLPQ